MSVPRRTFLAGAAGTSTGAALGPGPSAATVSAAPDPVLDGEVAELVTTAGTQTQNMLDGRYVQIAHRPVNLADRLPAGYDATADASGVVQAALAESPHVEWPHATTLRLTAPVVVPAGHMLVGHAGALARIDHSGTGFEVAGTLRGIEVARVTTSSSLMAVGAWLVPGSIGARVEHLDITGNHAAGIAVGGSPETRTGTAIDATAHEVRVGPSTATSSYNFRLDGSQAATLNNCIGLGADLDNIKARTHTRDFRVVGGRYTGSVNGDGIDAFTGGEGGYIGGGVVFEDAGRNGIVVKTDFPAIAGVDPQQQGEQRGLPRQIIIDGVIIRRPFSAGIALHRTDTADSVYAAGVRLPWLADVVVTSVVIENAGGTGIVINGYNFLIDGVEIIRPRSYGVDIYPNARQHRLSRVAVRAAGYLNPSTTIDGFRLNGKQLWLSQCVSYGVVGDFVDDSDYAAATKHTRFGFVSAVGTGATHHFAQCAASAHRTAAIAGETPTHARHTDGDYEGYGAGLSLGGLWLRGNAGTLEKSTGGITGFTPV